MNEILSPADASVTIEFHGLARQKAGRADLAIPGLTVAQLLDHVERTCPGLAGLLNDDGSISRKYLVSLNGTHFIDDPATIVPTGTRLFVLGAEAQK